MKVRSIYIYVYRLNANEFSTSIRVCDRLRVITSIDANLEKLIFLFVRSISRLHNFVSMVMIWQRLH